MKLKMMLMAIVAVFTMNGCYFTQVDSGESGVQLNWGEAQDSLVTPGLAYSLNPGAELEIFNIKSKRLEMKNALANLEDNKDEMFDGSVTILSKNGLPLPVEMTVIYRVNPTEVVDIYKKYGTDIVWDNKLIVPQVRDVAREVMGSANIYELNTKRNEYSSKIVALLNQKVGTYAFIEQVMIKRIGIPAKIRQSIEQKMQMKEAAEKAKYEVEKARQNAEKKVAIAKGEAEKKKIDADAQAYKIKAEADAMAQANIKISKSITPELVQYKSIEKWNGVMPRVTSEASQLLNLRGI